MAKDFQCVFVANGEAQAQQVRSFLEAGGIPTVELGESLRNTHGLTLDGLGSVRILVADEHVDAARSLLRDAETGTFRIPDEA